MKRKVLAVLLSIAMILPIIGNIAFAQTPGFEFTMGTAGNLKNTLTSEQQEDILSVITAEYNAQTTAGFDFGQLQDDDWGKIHLWDDQGVKGICIRFEKGDSTSIAYSTEGPWYGIFQDSWLGVFFQNENLAIIFAVEQKGVWKAYTLKNEAMDAAWLTNGFKDTGAPISNEFITDEGYLAQNFQKGAVLIYDMEDFQNRRTEFVDTYWFKNLYVDSEGSYLDKLPDYQNGFPYPIIDYTNDVYYGIDKDDVIDGVYFSDINLVMAIRRQLNIPTGFITEEDMKRLDKLLQEYYYDEQMESIKSLEGLEYAINLEYLHLGWNEISDITPLENLVKLTFLELSYNKISDIKPLENLVNIEHLYLWGNLLTEITPLQNLVKLTDLDLSGNEISDITPLENLVDLIFLDLRYNSITDITVLENLKNLEMLFISGNNIDDLTPLDGLENLEYVDIYDDYYIDFPFLDGFEDLEEFLEYFKLTFKEVLDIVGELIDIGPYLTDENSQIYKDLMEIMINSLDDIDLLLLEEFFNEDFEEMDYEGFMAAFAGLWIDAYIENIKGYFEKFYEVDLVDKEQQVSVDKDEKDMKASTGDKEAESDNKVTLTENKQESVETREKNPKTVSPGIFVYLLLSVCSGSLIAYKKRY